MQFRSVKSATNFINKLRVTRGFNKDSTSEWRRLTMKLSDCALIQFARRLAYCLENERKLLVGVDEQDFKPKIYVLDGNRYCVLCLSKRVDEQTDRATYALGHISDPDPPYVIDVSKPPTDEDLTRVLALIGATSWQIGSTECGNGKTAIKRRTDRPRTS